MAIKTSYSQQAKRQYPGEEAALSFLRYIQGLKRVIIECTEYLTECPKDHPTREKMKHRIQGTRSFVKAMVRILKDLQRLHESGGKARRTKWNKPQFRKLDEQYERSGATRLPSSFSGTLYFLALHRAGWAIDWKPRRGLVFLSEDMRVHALLGLLELYRRGLVHRVGRCPRCGEWFYARFKHQRFCTGWQVGRTTDPYWNKPGAESHKDCQLANWRNKHPEKNAEYQKRYRKNLFGEARPYRRRQRK